MDILAWARFSSSIRQRFDDGEELEPVAAELKVPPDALRGIYDEYVLEKLEDDIRARPSFKQLQRHRRLGAAIQVLNRNSAELLGVISLYDAGTLSEGMGQLRSGDEFFATVSRLLHNYVAAAITAVYHIEEAAKESAFRNAHPEAYREHFEDHFKKHDLSMFVRHLRNKTLKEYFAAGMASASVGTSGFEFGPVAISLTDTLNEPMSREARRFIQQREGIVEIRSVVDEYDRHVDDFVQWMIQVDLQELDECYTGLQDDLRRLQALADSAGKVVNLPYLAKGVHAAKRHTGKPSLESPGSLRPFQRPAKFRQRTIFGLLHAIGHVIGWLNGGLTVSNGESRDAADRQDSSGETGASKSIAFRYHYPPEVVGGAAELPDLFVSIQLVRQQNLDDAVALVASLPPALRQAPCFLDRLTRIWRYEFGDAAGVDGPVITGGGITWHTVTHLIDVVSCARWRLTSTEYDNYLQRLADPIKHADMLFEFAPVLRLDSSTAAAYEVTGRGNGNSTIDWLLTKSDGARMLLEVKRRQFDLLEHLEHLAATISPTTSQVPSPTHDTDRLFKSVESKFVSRAHDEMLQGVWIGTGIKQEVEAFEESFARLDPTKVHFVVLGLWDDAVHLLTREGISRDNVCDLLRIRQTDQFTVRGPKRS